MDASSQINKQYKKLGYTRSSLACVHCRKRKIRCILETTNLRRKCHSCTRLQKDCRFCPVDTQKAGETTRRLDSNIKNQPSTSTTPRSVVKVPVDLSRVPTNGSCQYSETPWHASWGLGPGPPIANPMEYHTLDPNNFPLSYHTEKIPGPTVVSVEQFDGSNELSVHGFAGTDQFWNTSIIKCANHLIFAAAADNVREAKLRSWYVESTVPNTPPDLDMLAAYSTACHALYLDLMSTYNVDSINRATLHQEYGWSSSAR